MRRLARLWSPDLRQIDLDVNRTYRDHLMFRERYGLKQQALFHVLGAYSVYNSEIGMITKLKINKHYSTIIYLFIIVGIVSRLLSRNVTNRRIAFDVPQWRRRFLGFKQSHGESQMGHAWYELKTLSHQQHEARIHSFFFEQGFSFLGFQSCCAFNSNTIGYLPNSYPNSRNISTDKTSTPASTPSNGFSSASLIE